MSGPQCCEHPPNLVGSDSGKGSLVELGGLKTYVSGSSDSSNIAVLLISDVYGYEAPKLRKLADKVAFVGYYVVVPDFFYGDPFVVGSNGSLDEWLKSHTTIKGFKDAKPVIEALKSRGISAIGAAGFCWGGKVVAELAKSGHIQAAVLLHPSMVTVNDIQEVKVAIAVLGAEFDKISPPKLLKQYEEVLSTKPEVVSYVKIYDGVKHGWTVRYKDEDKMEVKSAEEAHGDMIAWVNKHLKAKNTNVAKL